MIDINKFFQSINYGLQDDMPYEEYFKISAINCSALKFCNRTPYHMDKYLEGCFKEEKKEYNFGNYFHLYTFEEEKFNKFCYVLPPPETPNRDGEYKWDRRLKAHKDFYNYCLEIAGNREIVMYEDFEKMKIMRESIEKFENIKNYMNKKGFVEKIGIWQNEDTGINCKCIFDKFIPNEIIIDLKTTKDASPYGFLKDFERYLYKVQAAIYTDALIAMGYGDLPFIFISVEHSPPYYCQIYEVSLEKINEGRQIYIKNLQKYIDYKNNKIDLSKIYVI